MRRQGGTIRPREVEGMKINISQSITLVKQFDFLNHFLLDVVEHTIEFLSLIRLCTFISSYVESNDIEVMIKRILKAIFFASLN